VSQKALEPDMSSPVEYLFAAFVTLADQATRKKGWRLHGAALRPSLTASTDRPPLKKAKSQIKF
jgi:hypothetical protein